MAPAWREAENLEIRDVHRGDDWYVATCGHVGEHGPARVRNAAMRQGYLAGMEGAGLRVKAAREGGRTRGFIQYCPIEIAARPFAGGRLVLIHCVNAERGAGYGRALVEAAEADARTNALGIAVEGYEHPDGFWFMPAEYFRRLGYVEAARRGIGRLMWKAFSPAAEPPRYLEPRFDPDFPAGRVAVDLFFTPLCGYAEVLIVREVCAGYGDRVLLREYNAGDPEVRNRYGIVRALFVNGRGRCGGDVVTPDELRAMIERAVADPGPPRVSFDPERINLLF